MAELVSVVGGLLASVSLDPAELASAQAAVKLAGKGLTDSEIHSNLAQAPASGVLNVYDITAVAGKTYVQKTGEQVVILQGSASATLTGLTNATNNLLIGNNGADTINTKGGTGTVIVGDGKNVVNVTGGTQKIITGAASSVDTIVMAGGNVTVVGNAQTTVSVTGGADSISSSGTLKITATGTDTITLYGTGADTITATGSATIHGGAGSLRFNGGINSTVVAGSGAETMVGGTGKSTFYGNASKTSTDTMYGGSGANLFKGGKGHDLMISGFAKGSTSSIFEFSSTMGGGVHTVNQFHQATDKIELQGYTAADVTKISMSGSNTVIKLDDGTTITVGAATVTIGQIKFV